MARPIPTNHTGLQRRRRFEAEAFVPAWDVLHQPPPRGRDLPQQSAVLHPEVVSEVSWKITGIILLAVSGLTGGLAVVSSLGVWHAMAASSMGLDERGAFFLLAVGVYLLATMVYAAWRTRLLRDLHRAPWDARLMAYANLCVGGAVSAALGVMALAILAFILLLVGVIALLLSGTGGQSQG